MKVQTRLSLFCSVVFGVIFAVISLLIFGLYYKNAEQQMRSNLKKTAFITGIYYLEEDELNISEYENVKKQFEALVSDSYYQIYNEKNVVAYGAPTPEIPAFILDKIRKEEYVYFSSGNFFCYGVFYIDNQGDFVVVSKVKEEEFNSQLHLLLWILSASFFIGMISIILFSRWVSRVAYRPFSKVIDQVNRITTNNLDVQIKSPETKDELQELTDTFNNLLATISETVIIQKNFVNYVSHEFKTPLASMLGNLEVFSMKDRSPQEYEQLSKKLIGQISELEEILNTLMIISDLKKETESFDQTRIDELVWEIIRKLSEHYPESKIQVDIDIAPEDENLLITSKNSIQILMALFNIIENAVKYSNGKTVNICLSKNETRLCLLVIDKGIGIPQDQLAYISKPFYRADNSSQVQGSGIGLSIALRILEKAGINYSIESQENIGTRLIVLF